MSNKPVVLGGEKAITEDHKINCQWPITGSDELNAIAKIFDDGDISTHPVRYELEAAFCDKFNRNHAVSHNNGTSALFAGFFACGLGEGDEVLVTSATWWSSVLPMLWLGAIPVFCECENERLGISVIDMEKKITHKTKALVVVHLWGMPGKMDEIMAFAKKHKLIVIEDASHAHGAFYDKKPCGSFGDVSIFSLQGDKLSPAGEGGILLTDDKNILEKVITFGDVTRILALDTPARRFAGTGFGMKTRMAPVSAAIGLSQLKKLDFNNKRRTDNIEYVSTALENLGFDTFMGDDKYQRTYFEFIIKWTPECGLDIDRLVDCLLREGAQVAATRYPLLHQQPFFTEGVWNDIARLKEGSEQYNYNDVILPETESENGKMIRLPHFSTASRSFLDQYITAFEKVISHAEKINEL